MALFELKNETVRYDGHAVLSGVSFAIDAGERVALVGRSGAGKTTLLKILQERHPDGVALVPQDLGLVQALTVFHNIYMGRLDRHGAFYNLANLIRPMRGEVEGARAVAARLGMADKLTARVGGLSGGQRQRTAIGRALYRGAPVFLGDEPVSAVDEHQSRDVLEAIVEAHETVVIAMHDIRLALEFTDRLIGLKAGRVEFDMPTSGLTEADLAPLYRDFGPDHGRDDGENDDGG